MQLKKTLFISLLLTSPLVMAQAPVEDINDPNRYANSANAAMGAQVYEQLQQLRAEIMTLRGVVEEQGHQIRQLKQQGLDRYIDIDRRLAALSGTAPSAAVSGEASTELPVDTVPAATSPAKPAANAGVDATADAQTDEFITGQPSIDYANAYGLVKSREYLKAIEAFKAYVARYPDDRYTPNAWYWLGELYVAVKPQNLDASATAFQTLLSAYPDNNKVPAAMYKLGTVYFLQGDKPKARELLTHVIDRYGNTGNSAVKKAREFLRNNY